MSRTVKGLATKGLATALLATASSLAIACAGTPPQDPTAAAQPRSHPEPTASHVIFGPNTRMLTVTYVVPGSVLPQASAKPTPAPAPTVPAPSASPAPPLASPVAATLPLPPAPAPVPAPKLAAAEPSPPAVKATPAHLPVQDVPVLRVADTSSPTAAPNQTITHINAQTTTQTTAQPAGGVDTLPMKSLQIGVGGGVLLHLPAPASTVFAADPTIARVEAASPTSIFVIGMKKGATNLIATNPAGEAIAQYVVEVGGSVIPHKPGVVQHHVSGPYVPSYVTGPSRNMQTAINQIVPGANLVKVQKVGGAYLLTGVVATPEIAQEAEAIGRAYSGSGDIIDKIQVLSSIQVNVRVRVAEVSRSMVRQLGLNWQALGKSSNWRFGLLTGAAATAGISPLLPLGISTSAGGSPFQLGAGVTSGNGKWNLDNVIDALAGNQLATILAEPNLTVESGHKADFLSGGEYPIPVPSTGSNSVSIQYKEYGVSLSVTPTVIAPDKISLSVAPEVSQLTSAGAISVITAGGPISVPALTVRKAQTVVELGSGQAFAIAGLLQSTTNQTGSSLPGTSNIPILGALFRQSQYQRTDDELVIIVTPYLVNPVGSPSKLHAPTDGFVPATDLQQILYGKEVQNKDQPPSSVAPLDAGFLME